MSLILVRLIALMTVLFKVKNREIATKLVNFLKCRVRTRKNYFKTHLVFFLFLRVAEDGECPYFRVRTRNFKILLKYFVR